MLRVNEMFYSIQGEVDVGKPTIFIRLQGCNMQPKCEWCDSSYSWNEGKEMSNKEIIDGISEWLKVCRYIVFTGGEPMCQISDVEELCMEIMDKERDVQFGLETNGLVYSDKIWLFQNMSVSPKKQNFNLESLNQLNAHNTRYKFVFDGDLWFENVIKELDLEPWQVWIMPEGMTKDKQEEIMKDVIEYCKKKGYNFSPRLHILVWDMRRAV